MSIKAFQMATADGKGTVTFACNGWFRRECDVADMSSRDADLSAGNAFAASKKAKVEALLGRKLTIHEESVGFDHAEIRSPQERRDNAKAWDDLFAVMRGESVNVPEDILHYRKMLADHEEKLARDADPEGFTIRKNLAAAEARHASADRQAAREATTEYRELQCDARGWAWVLLYDPRASVGHCTDANKLIEYLEAGGSIAAARALLKEQKQAYAAFLASYNAEEVAKLEARSAQLKLEVDELTPAPEVPAKQEVTQ
jgi:hypothetical protein